MIRFLAISALAFSGGCSLSPVKCTADQVVIGMSESELLSICGIPKIRNYRSYDGAQWVYRGPEGLYVYMNSNGTVRSKQWSN